MRPGKGFQGYPGGLPASPQGSSEGKGRQGSQRQGDALLPAGCGDRKGQEPWHAEARGSLERQGSRPTPEPPEEGGPWLLPSDMSNLRDHEIINVCCFRLLCLQYLL